LLHRRQVFAKHFAHGRVEPAQVPGSLAFLIPEILFIDYSYVPRFQDVVWSGPSH
jgi:hypothetical protein